MLLPKCVKSNLSPLLEKLGQEYSQMSFFWVPCQCDGYVSSINNWFSVRYRKHLGWIKNVFGTSFHYLRVSSVTTAVEMENSSSLMRTKNNLP